MFQEVDIRFAIVYNRRDFGYCLDVMNAGDFAPHELVQRTVGFDAFAAEFEAFGERGIAGKLMRNPSA
jgi:threonine dehydrogenase-like Zn-dependent dehydrogenase